MRNGADSLCGPLNHRKWLHVHHWEYKQRWQFGHSSVVMIAIDADDAIASLSTRRPLLDILILRTLFAVWLTGIICFVLIIPLPQQTPSIQKPDHQASSIITTSAARAPFQTAHCLIFQWNGNKAYVLQSWYTNYSVPVACQRERRQWRHQKQNALSFLSLSHSVTQACLPDGEEKFVKRVTVERVKPSPAPGKIEGDICM